MIKNFVLGVTAIVLGAGLLIAHGDPILGTVTAVSPDVVTIKDKDSKEVKVMVDAKTKYMMGTKAVKMSDVKVGSKVSIDAEMDTKMKMYVAESITVPADAAKATTTAKPDAKAPGGSPTTSPSTTTKTPATK